MRDCLFAERPATPALNRWTSCGSSQVWWWVGFIRFSFGVSDGFGLVRAGACLIAYAYVDVDPYDIDHSQTTIDIDYWH